MKGTFFQQPLEFNLRVEGESWNQGDPLSGVLTLKNHSPTALTSLNPCFHLALGELKKVRLKAPDAFEVIASGSFPTLDSLAPQAEASFPFQIPTDRNCPITDSTDSLFLLYGRGDSLEKLGQLQLQFQPFPLIQELVKTLEIHFRFITKTRKSNKNRVEVKLSPPDSRAFTMVEHLLLSLHFQKETLEASYTFHVKQVEPSAASYTLKKAKKEFKQSLPPSQYLLASGRTNHEALEAAIDQALDLVRSKITL